MEKETKEGNDPVDFKEGVHFESSNDRLFTIIELYREGQYSLVNILLDSLLIETGAIEEAAYLFSETGSREFISNTLRKGYFTEDQLSEILFLIYRKRIENYKKETNIGIGARHIGIISHSLIRTPQEQGYVDYCRKHYDLPPSISDPQVSILCRGSLGERLFFNLKD